MHEIVDTHTHVISPDHTRYPLAPVGGRQSDWSAHHSTDYETLLKALDEAGISRAMVVQASTAYGNDNRYVNDAVRAHPDRLCGVFSIDMLAGDNVDQMRRWLEAGMSGLRLFTTGTTMPGQADWFDDERTFPVWEYAQEHDVSICVQMAAAGIPKLAGLLTRFPGVRVLLDHLARPNLAGGPPYESAALLFALAGHAGVHLKLTNRTIREAARGTKRLAARPRRKRFFHAWWRRLEASGSPGARTTLPLRARLPPSWPKPGTRCRYLPMRIGRGYSVTPPAPSTPHSPRP